MAQNSRENDQVVRDLCLVTWFLASRFSKAICVTSSFESW